MEEIRENNLCYYKSYDGSYTVTCEIKENVGEVVIPSDFREGKIKRIGLKAFKDSDLSKITLPKTVTSIGERAFDYCYNLNEITVPISVSGIGEGAFLYCSSLVIYCECKEKPDGWNENWNYSKCPVVWNCSVNDVADNGFIYTVVDGIRYGIKDGIAVVTDRQISKNMTEAKIKPSITYKGVEYQVAEISPYAFSCFSNIEKVYIPRTVKKIGKSAFFNCNGLTGVYIEDLKAWCEMNFDGYDETNPLYHAHDLYLNGERVCDLVVDGNIEKVSDGSFTGASIRTLKVAPSVKYIGIYAFKSCRNLQEAYISSKVASIGMRAFEYCTAMTVYTEAKQKPQGWDESWASSWTGDEAPIVWDSENNDVASNGKLYTSVDMVKYMLSDGKATVVVQHSNSDEVYIPETVVYKSKAYTVTEIMAGAFMASRNLKKIRIPKTVEFIGCGAFDYIDDLTIYCAHQSKPEGWDFLWNNAGHEVIWGYKK